MKLKKTIKNSNKNLIRGMKLKKKTKTKTKQKRTSLPRTYFSKR